MQRLEPPLGSTFSALTSLKSSRLPWSKRSKPRSTNHLAAASLKPTASSYPSTAGFLSKREASAEDGSQVGRPRRRPSPKPYSGRRLRAHLMRALLPAEWVTGERSNLLLGAGNWNEIYEKYKVKINRYRKYLNLSQYMIISWRLKRIATKKLFL